MKSGRAKRILMVIDEMEVGGTQRQVVHLLSNLDRAEWEPELLYFRHDSFLVEQLRSAGITVRHLPKHSRIDLRFVLGLARLLRRERYDLIQTFSLTAELWTMLASRFLLPRPPLVSSMRNIYLDAPAWYWPLKRLVFWQSAAAIANAQAAARIAALRTRRPREWFDVIVNGVDLPAPMSPAERQSLRAALGVPAGRVFGLFVGRLATAKNLPCLLDALAALAPDQRPWVALAGEGPSRSQLERQRIGKSLQSDLKLLGERTDATRLMQAADFLVLCSHQEGMSNALLEAMAAACPVIASDVGGNPELVEHERTGLLVRADDRIELAAALARLTQDSDLRAMLSTNAREQARGRHGLATLVAATGTVYERCLARCLPVKSLPSGGRKVSAQ